MKFEAQLATIRAPMHETTLSLMHEAALAGSAVLLDAFAALERLEVQSKRPADLVSEADLGAEAAIRAVLEAARPELAFLGEESGYQAGRAGESGGLEWVVDPLDGTTNFLCGIPHFAVSIALREAGGPTLAGLVYQPLTRQAFAAIRGQGATLDGEPIRVSPRRSWERAVVATGIPHRGRPHQEAFTAELAAVGPKVGGVRRFGSAALDLAWVAWGRYDGFWERGIQTWDVAAGNLLVREAGGVLTGIDDGQDPETGEGLIAATPWFHPELLATLRAANRSVL
ncbi:Archaeal fructose-1,6-bisphosphatase and related enzyme of inositol monophosphatase family protein [Plesiocystis pacifica SIR-1]|uniref:Inositol-1-monophosphatase n=2 Tax=Plesiocystis pacifica TaxID=191768 RepID=A6G3A2_9BACT|nr:Archaeal fructose-1,6-bisphosphatase and related enzyme of inositol monophosphatase family protein [Plesiocystis pacifica SIR-1]